MNIRKLLSKDAIFLWQPEQQREFELFKKELLGPLGLRPFDTALETQLWVDFSKEGMGLVLTQSSPEDTNDRRVVWCIRDQF